MLRIKELNKFILIAHCFADYLIVFLFFFNFYSFSIEDAMQFDRIFVESITSRILRIRLIKIDWEKILDYTQPTGFVVCICTSKIGQKCWKNPLAMHAFSVYGTRRSNTDIGEAYVEVTMRMPFEGGTNYYTASVARIEDTIEKDSKTTRFNFQMNCKKHFAIF